MAEGIREQAARAARRKAEEQAANWREDFLLEHARAQRALRMALERWDVELHPRLEDWEHVGEVPPRFLARVEDLVFEVVQTYREADGRHWVPRVVLDGASEEFDSLATLGELLARLERADGAVR